MPKRGFGVEDQSTETRFGAVVMSRSLLRGE